VDYYSLRFQIEFNFRDAKQYWGLEDFMNMGVALKLTPAIWSRASITVSATSLP
jgi:putative transposase